MFFTCKMFYFSVSSLYLIPKVSFLQQLLGLQKRKKRFGATQRRWSFPALAHNHVTDPYNLSRPCRAWTELGTMRDRGDKHPSSKLLAPAPAAVML